MIEAKKSGLFQQMFSLYHRRLVSRSFDHIYWQTAATLPTAPVIFIANHSSWWDGLIFFHLERTALAHELYIMMHEAGLRQYPFFKRLGAFSVNRSQPKEILRSLHYAEQLLKEGKSVCLFPQGDEFHLETRPLRFQSGVTYLLERCPQVPLVPLSFYYSFGHHRKPDVWVFAGQPLVYEQLRGGSRKERTLHLEQLCTKQLDKLKQYVIHEQHQLFTSLL
ncbi:lysophospholipid acyltransferase family protein [Bacillus sp. REN10]|uniref:lysophospholipid acyltransferase family protein n=1 Tax=Bacillus sp. REN10 TaxID=2782541 RepID=UPI00193C5910|nr:lysophospholipid acyltransferase family protein [Bacillus sp. REN10]